MPCEIAAEELLQRRSAERGGMRGAQEVGTDFTPAVPRFGSVGASGDLIPLGYAVQALRGRGRAYVGGEAFPADEALKRAGLSCRCRCRSTGATRWPWSTAPR
ncbi:aromatic amino acid lyase [Streptomyces sp. 6N223]|uniref:aromatic amino acid lyase n=1 Tax=Streptomyces sp. 6N223 TaxID=3457412 RepID=UPI003FD04F19